MDRILLLETVRQLDALGPGPDTFARGQAVRQFNSLLADAQSQYPGRADIKALRQFVAVDSTISQELMDAIRRLKVALELRPVASITTLLEQIQLPEDASASVGSDFAELREAATLGLAKTVLLLSGLIAESLLLSRHPDRSDRGPGLAALVKQAREQKVFGRDTLRQLETLIDSRRLTPP